MPSLWALQTSTRQRQVLRQAMVKAGLFLVLINPSSTATLYLPAQILSHRPDSAYTGSNKIKGLSKTRHVRVSAAITSSPNPNEMRPSSAILSSTPTNQTDKPPIPSTSGNENNPISPVKSQNTSKPSPTNDSYGTVNGCGHLFRNLSGW